MGDHGWFEAVESENAEEVEASKSIKSRTWAAPVVEKPATAAVPPFIFLKNTPNACESQAESHSGNRRMMNE